MQIVTEIKLRSIENGKETDPTIRYFSNWGEAEDWLRSLGLEYGIIKVPEKDAGKYGWYSIKDTETSYMRVETALKKTDKSSKYILPTNEEISERLKHMSIYDAIREYCHEAYMQGVQENKDNNKVINAA